MPRWERTKVDPEHKIPCRHEVLFHHAASGDCAAGAHSSKIILVLRPRLSQTRRYQIYPLYRTPSCMAAGCSCPERPHASWPGKFTQIHAHRWWLINLVCRSDLFSGCVVSSDSVSSSFRRLDVWLFVLLCSGACQASCYDGSNSPTRSQTELYRFLDLLRQERLAPI